MLELDSLLDSDSSSIDYGELEGNFRAFIQRVNTCDSVLLDNGKTLKAFSIQVSISGAQENEIEVLEDEDEDFVITGSDSDVIVIGEEEKPNPSQGTVPDQWIETTENEIYLKNIREKAAEPYSNDGNNSTSAKDKSNKNNSNSNSNNNNNENNKESIIVPMKSMTSRGFKMQLYSEQYRSA